MPSEMATINESGGGLHVMTVGFLSSFKVKNSYTFFLDHCARLFNHYMAHQSRQVSIGLFTSHFISKFLPIVVALPLP
jgi:hypothetical protein